MSRGKILIVEDDANLLAGIRDILQLENYTVLTATDGEAGLAVLEDEEYPPDLIVSDIMMPRMDGIQFLMKVREIDRFVSIPFIYLTAKGEK
ncbi:MAG: response regulator, partial [Chloroflexota bacterium]